VLVGVGEGELVAVDDAVGVLVAQGVLVGGGSVAVAVGPLKTPLT